MIKIAVCDDNINDTENIKRIITEYMSFTGIQYMIEMFNTGESIIAYEQKFNIIFLDINMGNGINGILTGQILKKKFYRTSIIYVTSFSDYIREAVNCVHAYAYLNKPVTKDDVVLQLSMALEDIQAEKDENNRIKFEIIDSVYEHKSQSYIKVFNVNDIYYFEYFNRKIVLRTKDEKCYITDNMKNIIDKMKPYGFINCHRDFLVNLDNVNSIKGYDLYMKNGDLLPVSQKRSAEYRIALKKNIQRQTIEKIIET